MTGGVGRGELRQFYATHFIPKMPPDMEMTPLSRTIPTDQLVDEMVVRFTHTFSRLSAVAATQAKQWLDIGTNTLLDVTSPDNVLVSGRLVNGAVASVHIGAIPFAGSGYRMEIYGRAGTLVATGEDSPQLSKVSLHGAKGGNTLAPLPIPARFKFVATEGSGRVAAHFRIR